MDEWEETLAQLRGQYLQSAAERLQAIEQSLDVLERNPGDVEALKHLARTFHKLAGSGGTYGFPRISELGFQGEVECENAIGRDIVPSPKLLALLRSVAAGLGQELARHPPGDVEC